MGIGTPSGTWSWNPPLAEHFLEALERIQVFGPAIEDRHIIGLRRSANFILTDLANRGINLWTVDQINFGLIPGQATYQLPGNTVDVLDTYLRNYSFVGGGLALGHGLAAAHTATFDPVLTALGEPVLVGPSSGTFSTVAGSQTATMYFPNHGLSMGAAIMPQTPLMIGPMTLWGMILVSTVIDQNNIQFLLPAPAIETRNGVGGTPLFVTKSGSASVTVVLPGHGLSVGATFPVQVATAVGGLILSGNYTVQSLPNPTYDFTITSPIAASSNALGFESSGQINLSLPGGAAQPSDLILTPISRNDYAALPLKSQPGRPTSFWFDRTTAPTVTVWPVPPIGSSYGFVAFRTRRVMDANPASGETLDAPSRFYNTFVAELTAAAAEKWKPEKFVEKATIAIAAWDRASSEDREKDTLSIYPIFPG